MISYLFNEVFYKPLFNGLIFLYNTIPNHDMGVSIIVLTIIIRLILWPLTNKSIRSQKALAALQPKIEEIKKKFKDNKEAQAKALMAVYSENKINPLGGILPILIQIPIIFALWRVFLNSISSDFSSIYPFIQAPAEIQTIFLGLFDLTKRSMLLAVIAGVLQYFQTKMIMPSYTKTPEGRSSGNADFGRIMSKQMLYFGPVISMVIFWTLPAALPLYWIVVTLMTILQQYLNKNNGKT
ncbi:MAG: Membrane protein insertase YidC [Microgenomates group bacterium GW2011_GWC1_41_8]|uniref:Membrane protein insertase YidC n=1 Tax=Candidatus Azambacteria bacterium GW2011_GWA2_39_10 TaxID=1618611 RepID=A0A0G0NZ29_9BACT|nr:MAG: Membrane protein insertase YidC [Candidatus Azambacteria bacterium GW2011_GWA2_39_10]KKS21812.1 MAG: Membrane protein insertase YidC [Microgenomates group bacterium GW2011_GWC1_41_8]